MSGIKIGKKLIITLTSGMYEDPRFVFREYIQNSADQIDIALKTGLLYKNDASIIINIDKQARNIIFYDNATGIESSKVKDVLGNVANSEKSGVDTKGFIGIGRLGGLAYCDKLQFITSFKGESSKTIMTWDAKKLNELIHDPGVDDDAAQVIQRVFEIQSEPAEEDDHFFEVRMLSVHRSSNALLDVDSVREYLSMVAPVPFSAFLYANKIMTHIADSNYEIPPEYCIIINNEQLFKAYRKSIYKVNGSNKEVCDTLHDVRFKEFRLSNGELAAWMWYGLSNFESQINKLGNVQRGLRLRCKNIQIGDDFTIISKKFFKEDRGTHYFVGEIHIVHPNIRPNSRRDYFIENDVLNEFEHLLKVFCSEYLNDLYYDASRLKNAIKKENELSELITKYDEKKEKGFASKVEESTLNDKIKSTQVELNRRTKTADKIIQKAKSDNTLDIIVKGIESKYKQNINTNGQGNDIGNGEKTTKPKSYLTDQLSKLKRGEVKVVRRIFDIIHRVLTPDQAEQLVQKIVEELKH